MIHDNAFPRPKQAIYHPPGPEFQDRVNRLRDRQDLDGLSPVERLKFRLDGYWKPSGEGFVTECPICLTEGKLSFAEGWDGRLLLFCHKCEAPFEEIMESFDLPQWNAFPGRPNGNGEISITALLSRHHHTAEDPCEKIDKQHVRDWTAAHTARVASLAKIRELAERLGVTRASLQQLGAGWEDCPMTGKEVSANRSHELADPPPSARSYLRRIQRGYTIGWSDPEGAWTFPERDSQGRVIGLLRRFHNPAREKQCIPGQSCKDTGLSHHAALALCRALVV